MNTNVTLLTVDDAGAMERNLVKIVEFMGGTIRLAKLARDQRGEGATLDDLVPSGGCVIAHASALENRLLPSLRQRNAHLLVYGFDSTQRSSDLLKTLTDDCLIGVEQQVSGEKIRVASCREICRQVSSLEFETPASPARLVFKPSPKQGGWAALLSIGESPFFIRNRNDDRKWMLLAGDEIADLDAAVSPGASTTDFFAGLAPIMMFLRAATPDARPAN